MDVNRKFKINMEEKIMERYYLGLDMGTSSVGWAVTDEKYQIVRKKGKDLWGVRLFPEAQTAACLLYTSPSPRD